MSRWKYRSEAVTVGDNTQQVRQLTQRERSKFAEASRQIKDGKMDRLELPGFVAKMGCVDPPLTDEDLAEMPADLLDACVSKILELTGTGAGKDEDEPGTDPEKKDS